MAPVRRRSSFRGRRARHLSLYSADDGGLCAQPRGPTRPRAAKPGARMNGWLDRRKARSRVKQGYGFFRDNPQADRARAATLRRLRAGDLRSRRRSGRGHRPPDAARRRLRRAHARRLLRRNRRAALAVCIATSCPSGACRSTTTARSWPSTSTIRPSRARCIAAPSCACRCCRCAMPLSSNDDDAGHEDRWRRFPRQAAGRADAARPQ